MMKLLSLIMPVTAVTGIWLLIHLIPITDTDLTKNLFYKQITVPIEQNGDVYLQGLNVPAGQSPVEFGHKLYKKYETFTPELKKDWLHYDFNLEPPENIYTPEIDYDILSCWIEVNSHEKSCSNDQELRHIILDNKILLSRLTELWKFQHF